MKKFIRAIVLVMACVLVFATLASCGKSIDGIEKKAKDAGFEVEVDKFDEADEDGLVAVMEIVDPNAKSLVGAFASVAEYADADNAKKAYDEAKKELDELKKAAEESGVTINYTVKKSGKIVIFGTDDVVKKVW
ncbi:MAG: hypothetical protein E7607_09075 [Ruminococcaceae bacterium]|nr:hypothetical protein [Oscillospiraceae bacterium]